MRISNGAKTSGTAVKLHTHEHTSQQAHILFQWKKRRGKLKNESSESSVLKKVAKR